MLSRSSSALTFRGRRALLVAGLTAATVLVPSVAWAADGTGPGGVLTTVEKSAADVAGAGETATESSGDKTASGTDADKSTSSSSAAATPTPPSLDASQLNALLAQAGISTECSTSVEADVQQAIADIPATAAALLQEILGQLGGGASSPIALTDPTSGEKVLMQLVQDGPTTLPKLSSSDPAELALVTDLQQLLTDLLTKCIQPPTTTPPPTSAAPVATQTSQSVNPVSYLGYAPTGGSGPDGGSPALAVLGGGLVLTGAAGATWYGVRFRAARAQD